MESQEWGNCDHAQDVISLDTEPLKARLWALDKGNSNCSSKLIIYNLFQKINYTIETPENLEIHKHKLSYLVVDPVVTFKGLRAYVGFEGINYLLVFSFNEFTWTQLNLESGNQFVPVSTQFLAVSKRDGVLYMTGGEQREIYSLDLNEIRSVDTEVNLVRLINV